MKKNFNKIICLFIVVGLNWAGLFVIGQTVAQFNDAETSQENTYQAGTLDFSIINKHFEKTIGLTEKISLGSVVTNSGSLGFQYIIKTEKVSGNDNFCKALKLEAELNGIKKYDGDLMSLTLSTASTAPDTMLGSWMFELKMPFNASRIPHGDVCEIDLVFKGWQTNVANYGDGGFFDEERIRVHLTSKMIALNEFLPNPQGYEYGFNFGDDASDMPQGEWVELYNNSDFDFDLTGYYLTDADGNRIDVEQCRINSGSTIIHGKEFLVVYRNGGANCNSHNFSLNNGGDTINLFNNSNNLIDSYTYTTNSDYCDIEPTPGDENSTNTSGNCNNVPPNKSYARIPDGIGQWVDPIPTPGLTNQLGEEDQEMADTVMEYIAPEPQMSFTTDQEPEQEDQESISKLIDNIVIADDIYEINIEPEDNSDSKTENNLNEEVGNEDVLGETDEDTDMTIETETSDEIADEEKIIIEEGEALPAEENVAEKINENEEAETETQAVVEENNENNIESE